MIVSVILTQYQHVTNWDGRKYHSSVGICLGRALVPLADVGKMHMPTNARHIEDQGTILRCGVTSQKATVPVNVRFCYM